MFNGEILLPAKHSFGEKQLVEFKLFITFSGEIILATFGEKQLFGFKFLFSIIICLLDSNEVKSLYSNLILFGVSNFTCLKS
jgi:hypothetical protein